MSLSRSRTSFRPAPLIDRGPVEQLIARLYTDAERNDAQLRAEHQALWLIPGHSPYQQVLKSLLDRAFMPVAPAVGRLLYFLVRACRPRLVVEFGASFGLSTVHLASGLRDNGGGHLITTEQIADKATRAAQHILEAGLSDLVEIRQGDAFQSLSGIEGIDLLFLDGCKYSSLTLLQQLEPAMHSGCVVIAAGAITLANPLAAYLAYVRDVSNGYISCAIALDDGLELSVR